MRIAHIHIRNYRSIRNLELTPCPLTVLLGPNNHGKSNIVAALEFALTTSSKPVEDDFFAFREKDDNVFWVELTFDELTDQERKTFQRYVLSDGRVIIRKTARMNEGKIDLAYNGYCEEPDEEWLKASKAGDYTKRPDAESTPLAGFIPNGRLSKAAIEEAQHKYIDAHRDELTFTRRLEDSPLLGQRNVAGGVLPDFYLIPAVKDLSDEVKVKNTTTFGRLLNRAVQEMAESDERFKKIRSELDTLMKALNKGDDGGKRPKPLVELEGALEEELRSWGVKVDIEVTPPEIEKLFELGTNLHLDDGLRTLAERKGHGLQRAVIFGLVKAWASALRKVRENDEERTSPRKASDSLVFAMEEPELFLHPHAQRSLAQAVKDIAETEHHQVFLCTHSTHFVDLDRYQSISIVTKKTPQDGTSVRQCVSELFEGDEVAERKRHFHMAHWVNPDRGEMFFAEKVIFVEGETEKAILPALAEKLGCMNPNVSIVDCGSKYNLPLYIEIANAFKLKYLVIHDEDPLPDPIPTDWDGDKEEQKRRTFEMNTTITSTINTSLGTVEMFRPDFEREFGVSISQGKKKGKALAALDHFETMDAADIPTRLREVVDKCYTP